jgi:hypothetical protein
VPEKRHSAKRPTLGKGSDSGSVQTDCVIDMISNIG